MNWLIKIANKKFTLENAKKIGEEIGINWNDSPFSIEQFCIGLDIEHNEHSADPETDVAHGYAHIEGKIAWAHLKEMSDYYTKLNKMENEK